MKTKTEAVFYGEIPFIDKPVSRIVQGTLMLSYDKKEEAFGLLDEVYGLGVNTFDCAPVYGENGDAERILGRWISQRSNRDRIVLITKGAHHNQWRSRVTPYDILSDIHDSLARMSVSCIDLYFLHRDDPLVPVGPIMETLNSLQAQGKIRAFGASNWSHERIARANEYAAEHGMNGFVASSPYYGLAQQVHDPWGKGCVSLTGIKQMAARQWYQKSQFPVFAYSSLGNGFFSGRVRSDCPEMAQTQLGEAAIKGYCYPENFERLRRAEYLACAKKASVAQIALAWLLFQPLCIYALMSPVTGEQMRDNLQALTLSLTEREASWLNLEIAAL